ncbi:MAG: acyclic terpene utilization AtuA family protein [Planctomycetota bacterium]
MSWDPDFIGCDAGSTDGGPAYLGRGECGYAKEAVKYDLRLALLGARKKRIPLLIGSAGTAGGDINLAWTVEIAREIAREEGLHFKMAVIHSEQNKEYLKKKLAEGKITPLKPAPPFDEKVIDRREHIVGMMGAEPFIRALEEGAEVVIAGRSSDTSIYAAIPTQRGFSPGPVWHAAKILECGAACVTQRSRADSMFARIGQGYFVVEPPNPEFICTPVSVAAHTFYETASPVHLYEPSGMVDTSMADYRAESERAVRVSGSQFVPAAKYTIKLEGVEKAGYRSITVAFVRDPILIGQIDEWLDRLAQKVKQRTGEMFGDKVADGGYFFNVRVGGRNAVLGDTEPFKDRVPHELTLVLEATAPTQEIATAIMASAGHMGLHLSIPHWKGLTSNFAVPYSPRQIGLGPAYRFNINHVVEPADPYEMFPIEMVKV